MSSSAISSGVISSVAVELSVATNPKWISVEAATQARRVSLSKVSNILDSLIASYCCVCSVSQWLQCFLSVNISGNVLDTTMQAYILNKVGILHTP